VRHYQAAKTAARIISACFARLASALSATTAMDRRACLAQPFMKNVAAAIQAFARRAVGAVAEKGTAGHASPA